MSAGPIIALTGATGFVGCHLIPQLLADGYRIKALIRPQSLSRAKHYKNLDWIEGTLSDPQALSNLCEGADALIHMAGMITARSKDEYFAINTDAVEQVSTIAHKCGVKRFVFLSSLAAQEPQLSDYASSKRAGEVALAAHAGAMKTVVVRAPAVFGVGDKATKPIFDMIRRGVLPCPGGRNWRERKLSLIAVGDLVNFIVQVCGTNAFDDKTVSPSTAASITWPEFAKICGLARDKRVMVLPLPLSVLYCVAGITSIAKSVFGIGHLTRGKLREFLHPDWSVDNKLLSGTSLQFALKETIYAV